MPTKPNQDAVLVEIKNNSAAVHAIYNSAGRQIAVPPRSSAPLEVTLAVLARLQGAQRKGSPIHVIVATRHGAPQEQPAVAPRPAPSARARTSAARKRAAGG